MKRLSKLRRSIQAIAAAHYRLEELNDSENDNRLVEAMGLMRKAYKLIHDVKRDEQIKKNDSPTLRNGLAAMTLSEERFRERQARKHAEES